MDAFRFLGILPDQLDELTYHEFTVLLYANRLCEVDREYQAHKQAFLNQVVKQTEGTGKLIRPRYTTLQSFYDYEQELEKILHPAKYAEKQRVRTEAASFALDFNKGGE